MTREIHREFADGEIVPGTRYRVLGLIGVGGMGTVYDVEHVELGKRFVLKSLLRELERRRDLVGRIRQEWRALARLQHPNIVSVTDAGTSDTGVPFYVMERLEGEPLNRLLRRTRRLPMPQALEIAASVLDGLSAAHAIGVVHRDIKPGNVFVLSNGGVKLLDFGIAKMASSSAEVVTARGIIVGTPRYMSPEQVRGGRIDGRADIYSVGLLLYEMLAGAGPFHDITQHNQLVLAQLTRVPARLSNVVPDVPAALDELVACLLAKEPRDRPPSAAVVAQALRQYAGAPQRPVQAAAASPVPMAPARDAVPPPEGQTPDSGEPATEESIATLVMDRDQNPPRVAQSDSAGNTAIMPQADGAAPVEASRAVQQVAGWVGASSQAAQQGAGSGSAAQPANYAQPASPVMAVPPRRSSPLVPLLVAGAAALALLVVVFVGWALLRAQRARVAASRAAASASAAAPAQSANAAAQASPASSSRAAARPAASTQPPAAPSASAAPTASAAPSAASPSGAMSSASHPVPHVPSHPTWKGRTVTHTHRPMGLPGSGL